METWIQGVIVLFLVLAFSWIVGEGSRKVFRPRAIAVPADWVVLTEGQAARLEQLAEKLRSGLAPRDRCGPHLLFLDVDPSGPGGTLLHLDSRIGCERRPLTFPGAGRAFLEELRCRSTPVSILLDLRCDPDPAAFLARFSSSPVRLQFDFTHHTPADRKKSGGAESTR